MQVAAPAVDTDWVSQVWASYKRSGEANEGVGDGKEKSIGAGLSPAASTRLNAFSCGIAKKKAAESVKKAVADAQRAGADVRLVRVHVGTKSWESLKAAMAQVQFDLQKEQAWRFRLQHEVKTLNGWWEQARDRENKLNGTIQEMQQTSVEKDIEYQKLFHLYQKTREELDSQIKKCNDKLPASEGVVGITWP